MANLKKLATDMAEAEAKKRENLNEFDDFGDDVVDTMENPEYTIRELTEPEKEGFTENYEGNGKVSRFVPTYAIVLDGVTYYARDNSDYRFLKITGGDYDIAEMFAKMVMSSIIEPSLSKEQVIEDFQNGELVQLGSAIMDRYKSRTTRKGGRKADF